MLWSNVVDVVRGLLFVLAHWCGGSFGLAIVIASCAVRVMMLPLTLSAARRKLAAAHVKISEPSWRGARDALIQLPPAAALYSAVRGLGSAAGFLWIRDLSRPDRLVALLAGLTTASMTVIATGSGERTGAQTVSVLVPAIVTVLILAHLSAGVAVYSITNTIVGAAERRLAARTLHRARA